MTFTEAATEVLRLAGKPMHYKEITELAIEKNLLSHVGKSPEVTMGSRLAALLKKEDHTNPIVRVKPGIFGLREWDDKKEKPEGGKEAGSSSADVEEPGHRSASDVNALEVEAVTQKARPLSSANLDDLGDDDDGDDRPEISGDDALRADLAASGAELFDDEDDDDQPILSPTGGTVVGGPADPLGDGGRRRRRRRRRGRGGAQTEFPVSPDRASSLRLDHSQSTGGLLEGDSSAEIGRDPSLTMPRPLVRDRHQIMAGGSPTGIDIPLGEGEELAGRDLADAAYFSLTPFDRNGGPVPLRALVEAMMRRGRMAGDPIAATIQLSAAVRADNLRRTAASQRPRFRFSHGGRIALTDWLLGPELTRLEHDVIGAVERYRESARRLLLRRVQELPAHSLIELALLLLERIGMQGLKPVRRAGSSPGEAHFQGIHRANGGEVRVGIVIRKDGREIGRERVTDMRGALHHYGSATAGWVITTGQVLSGAREEANTLGAAPIVLHDGLAFCRHLEEHDVAVIRTRFPIALPDLDFLEALRG